MAELPTHDRVAAMPDLADRTLAIRICREILCSESDGPLQWAFIEEIEERLLIEEKAARIAVRYGAEQGWLLLEGEPIHSVILCDAAEAMLEASALEA